LNEEWIGDHRVQIATLPEIPGVEEDVQVPLPFKMNWWQKNIKIKKKNHQYWLWSVFPLGIIEGIKG